MYNLQETIQSMLYSVVPILICLTLHELAHGLVAYKLGDPTAKNAGRLTLNPLKHLDPIGTILLLFCGFGYAKPVPINMSYFKKPKTGMAVSAAAGPAMNILISAVCLFLYGLIGCTSYILYLTAQISAGLAVFNLIPIPPLDGSKILLMFLPDRLYYKYLNGTRWTGVILLILVWSGVLTSILVPMRNFVMTSLDWLIRAGYLIHGGI